MLYDACMLYAAYVKKVSTYSSGERGRNMGGTTNVTNSWAGRNVIVNVDNSRIWEERVRKSYI